MYTVRCQVRRCRNYCHKELDLHFTTVNARFELHRPTTYDIDYLTSNARMNTIRTETRGCSEMYTGDLTREGTVGGLHLSRMCYVVIMRLARDGEYVGM